MTGHSIAGRQECLVCGPGVCPHRPRLGPVGDRYPFLPPEVIAMSQQTDATDEAPPEVEVPRGRRRGGDRAKRPVEDRMHRPSEDR